MAMIGNVRRIRGEVKFEWKIKKFLELSDETDTRYVSPEFSFSGTSWHIVIYPNGDSEDESDGYVSLYFIPVSSPQNVTIKVSMSLKNVDDFNDAEHNFEKKFQHQGLGCGWRRFIPRPWLTKRRDELLPSDTLTVVCTLNNGEVNDGFLKLQQQFKSIFEDGNFSDIVLKVDDREFKSHRCVLAARSPVFLAMVTHDTKEKNTGVVDIKDVHPDIFSDLLSYLYTGSEEIVTPDNVVELFVAADRYQVEELKKSCHDYMLTHISVDNFCEILRLSRIYEEKHLEDTCFRFFVENSLPIVESPKWLRFAKKNPVTANKLHIKQLKRNKIQK